MTALSKCNHGLIIVKVYNVCILLPWVYYKFRVSMVTLRHLKSQGLHIETEKADASKFKHVLNFPYQFPGFVTHAVWSAILRKQNSYRYKNGSGWR